MAVSKENHIDGLVSIIMPAFNSGSFIADSIESVLAQSYGQWELLVYDDASLDDTFEQARRAAGDDKRIKIMGNSRNSGVSHARNKAIEEASGRYIAFLDSDDMWKPDKLEKQLDFMKETGCSLSYSSYDFIDVEGKPKKRGHVRVKEISDYGSLLKDNYIGMLTVVADLRKTGDIIFSGDRHEDLILWLGLLKEGHDLRGIDQNLASYRVSGSSLSGNKAKAALWRWRVYRGSEKLGLLQSLFYITLYSLNSIKKRIMR